MKPLESLNDTVQFTLTEAGADMWNGYTDRLLALTKGVSRDIFPRKQPGDVVKIVLWEAMYVFGDACYMGSSRLPIENCKIEVVDR